MPGRGTLGGSVKRVRKAGTPKAPSEAHERRVLYRINPSDRHLTLRDVAEKIEQLQNDNPELEVYFDGDEFAICGLPVRRRAIVEAEGLLDRF